MNILLCTLAIDQVTGVTLTCELMVDLFDHCCTVMWKVSECIHVHTHILCTYGTYVHATMKSVVKYTTKVLL